MGRSRQCFPASSRNTRSVSADGRQSTAEPGRRRVRVRVVTEARSRFAIGARRRRTGVNGCGSSSRRTGRRSSWLSHSRARCSSDLTAAGPDVQRGNSRINIQTCRTASMANLIIGCTANRDMRADRVLPENRILSRELGLLGVQAARMYSLIRPLRTGFRRIWRAWKFPAVRQGGWCSASGTRWPTPDAGGPCCSAPVTRSGGRAGGLGRGSASGPEVHGAACRRPARRSRSSAEPGRRSAGWWRRRLGRRRRTRP